MEYGPKKCAEPIILKSDLQDTGVKAIRKVWDRKDVFLFALEENIKAALENKNGEQMVEIDCRLEELQQELL